MTGTTQPALTVKLVSKAAGDGDGGGGDGDGGGGDGGGGEGGEGGGGDDVR